MNEWWTTTYEGDAIVVFVTAVGEDDEDHWYHNCSERNSHIAAFSSTEVRKKDLLERDGALYRV